MVNIEKGSDLGVLDIYMSISEFACKHENNGNLVVYWTRYESDTAGIETREFTAL
jgi:hypothetical protein